MIKIKDKNKILENLGWLVFAIIFWGAIHYGASIIDKLTLDIIIFIFNHTPIFIALLPYSCIVTMIEIINTFFIIVSWIGIIGTSTKILLEFIIFIRDNIKLKK